MQIWTALLRVLTVGALAATASAQAVAQSSEGNTRFVEIGSQKTRVQTWGLNERDPGQPVIIFEAGGGGSLETWRAVLPKAAELAPAIAYDRSGLGQSEWDGQAPTPQHVTARLKSLMDELQVKPPYLLVGHSWGGTLARYFAGFHPEDVAGVVYVDPGPIVTDTRAQDLEPFTAIGAGEAGKDAFWAAIGKLYSQAPPPLRAEHQVYRSLLDKPVEERGLPPAPQVPAVVVLAAKYEAPPPMLQFPIDPEAYFAADVRHRLTRLSEWALEAPSGTVVLSNTTTHMVPRDDPDLIVWAIRRVLAQRPQ